MKRILVLCLLVISVVARAQLATNSASNGDLDRLNVRISLGGPIQDTIAAGYKLGEIRTRPQDGLMYRYNAKSVGNQRWDYVYFGPSPSIIPTLDQVLARGNTSSVGISVGVSTFTKIKVPTLGLTGQLLMATISPDGTLGAQTIPGGGTLINSINGLTASVQFLKTSFSAATSPAWGDVTATHTLNLPILNTLDTGIVTPAMFVTWNGKYTLPGSGTTSQYLDGTGALQAFPAIPAQLNPIAAGGGIAITGVYPNLTFTVSSAGGTITSLIGDVTTSGGTGAVATTIGSNVVSYAKMQQVTASKILGNPTGSTVNVSEIGVASGVKFSGTNLIADTGLLGTQYDLTLKVSSTTLVTTLAAYMRYVDTVSLSNRINTKPTGNGTPGMLAYWGAAGTISTTNAIYDSANHAFKLQNSINFTGNPTTVDLLSTVTNSDIAGWNISGSTSTVYTVFNAQVSAVQGINLNIANLSNAVGANNAFTLKTNANQDVFQAFVNGNLGSSGTDFVQGVQHSGSTDIYVIGVGNISANAIGLRYVFTTDTLGNGKFWNATQGVTVGTSDSSNFFATTAWVKRQSFGSGGTGCLNCFVIGNNLSEGNPAIIRTNIGLGTLATLSSVNNANWVGTLLSPTNGGTGVNAGSAANGRLLIGNGSGFSLNPLTVGAPLVMNNGAGSISLGIDTGNNVSSLVTKAYLTANPSIISVSQGGAGQGVIYTNTTGTALFGRALQQGAFTIITKGSDSSLTIGSTLSYPQSVTVTSNVVALTGDQIFPGNSMIYMTSTGGTKGWFSYTSIPLASSGGPGLLSTAMFNKINFKQTVINFGSVNDSLSAASILQDSFYIFRQKFTANTGTFLTLNTTGSVFGLNQYNYAIDTTKIATRSYVLLNAGGSGAVTSLTSPGTTLTLNQSTGAITIDVNLARAFTWTAQHTFNNVAPIFATLTSSGGILYTSGTSGQVAQVTAGTSTQVLHGGTTPSFLAVTLTTDVAGILPIANGGNGTATPTITNGAGIGISGTWGNYTLTASNFYNADGTLTGARILSGGNFNLTEGSVASPLTVFTVNTTQGLNIFATTYVGAAGGASFGVRSTTINNTTTAANGTVTTWADSYFSQPTITSANTNVTYVNPSTITIQGAPVMSTNSLSTTALSLNVLQGNSFFGGNIVATGNVSGTWVGNPVAVQFGGTGSAVLTPYALLTGGTSGTGVLQQVAPGTSAQILQSGGSGALPTFFTPTNGTIAGWLGFSIPSVVTTLTGTANQVILTASTQAVTIALPQDIATSSTVTFGSITLGTGNVMLTRTDQATAFILRPNSVGFKTLGFAVVGGGALDVFAVTSLSTTLSGTLTVTGNAINNGTTTLNGATVINNTLKIVDGSQGAGKIFTSDASGNGSWHTPAGSGVASGTYTPSVIGSTNVAARTIGPAFWIQVGGVVTVTGQFTVSATAPGQVILVLGLPVSSSFSLATDLSGPATFQTGTTYIAGICFSDQIADVEVSFAPVNTSTYTGYYTYKYVTTSL